MSERETSEQDAEIGEKSILCPVFFCIWIILIPTKKRKERNDFMIYYTGDIHGGKHEIVHFTKRMNLTVDDVIVILGDVGANYYGTIL